MATFKAEKLELTQVNGGQEYEQGDFLQSDTINDVVEGTAYAQNVAEAANTKSDNAVSTANSANKTANAASAKVDTFEQRITTAQNTADTAVSNAATAQSTADSATTEINKIKNGTTVVPNANHANNADNANLATKAQQDVNGKPINTTYATVEYVDDLVTEKQGTRVAVNNVNVAELSFTSDPQTQITANKNAIAEAQSDISDIVSGTQTVGKATQDANGNVIDTTYAKLSQVVRTDAAQSLTDEAKSIAQRNMLSFKESAMGSTNTAGWYQVAALLDITPTEITIQGSYYNVPPNTVKIFAIRSYADTMMIAAFSDGSNIYQKVRIRYPNNESIAYIDVYMRANTDNPTNIYVTPYRRVNDTKVRAYATDMTYIGTEDKPSDTTTVIVDIINGINTTGTIYQQGAPVFATDPSKLEPSTANGWTQTTATGTLPSAGVYMIAFNHLPSQSMPWYYNPAILVYDGSSGSCIVTDSLSGATIVSIVVKPSGIQLGDPVHMTNDIEATNIYYKRIA